MALQYLKRPRAGVHSNSQYNPSYNLQINHDFERLTCLREFFGKIFSET
jgi:hypothetical protein